MPGEFFVGVDLGQARDYTAIVLVERVEVEVQPRRRVPYTMNPPEPGYVPAVTELRYHVRFAERPPLSTSYLAIVNRVRRILLALGSKPTLVVDATGVGRPVVDLFEANGIYPLAVTITGGPEAAQTGHSGFRVPKRDLVSALQVLLQARRLKIAADLPDRTALLDELTSFRSNISDAGHDSYGAAGSSHDDLVIALALACWQGLQAEKQSATTPVPGVSEHYVHQDDPNPHWLGEPRNCYPQGYRRGSMGEFLRATSPAVRPFWSRIR